MLSAQPSAARCSWLDTKPTLQGQHKHSRMKPWQLSRPLVAGHSIGQLKIHTAVTFSVIFKGTVRSGPCSVTPGSDSSAEFFQPVKSSSTSEVAFKAVHHHSPVCSNPRFLTHTPPWFGLGPPSGRGLPAHIPVSTLKHNKLAL